MLKITLLFDKDEIVIVVNELYILMLSKNTVNTNWYECQWQNNV